MLYCRQTSSNRMKMNTEYKGIKISENARFENAICLRLYLKMSISLIVRSIKLSARRHGSGDAFLRTAFFQRLIYQTHILEHGEADKIIANSSNVNLVRHLRVPI